MRITRAISGASAAAKCSSRLCSTGLPKDLSDVRSRWVPNLRDSKRAHNVFIVDKAHEFDRWAKANALGLLGDARFACAYNGKPHLAVGTDLEWRPGKKDAPGAVLQLSTPTSTCLVQLLYLDRMPAALKELMLHDRVLKVGVQVKQDLGKLMQDYDVPYAGHVDIGLAVPRLQEMNVDVAKGDVARKLNGRTGLASLCQQLLQVEMTKSKRVQNSLWDARQLSPGQIRYAAYDAIFSREIFESAVANGAFTERYFREAEIRALEEMTIGQYRNFRRLYNLYAEESEALEGIVHDLIRMEDERLMLIYHKQYTAAAQAYSSRLHSNLLFLRQKDGPSQPIRVLAWLQAHNLRCGAGVGSTRAEAVQGAARSALVEFLEVQRACDPREFLDHVARAAPPPKPLADYYNSRFNTAGAVDDQYVLLDDEMEGNANEDAENASQA